MKWLHLTGATIQDRWDNRDDTGMISRVCLRCLGHRLSWNNTFFCLSCTYVISHALGSDDTTDEEAEKADELSRDCATKKYLIFDR